MPDPRDESSVRRGEEIVLVDVPPQVAAKVREDSNRPTVWLRNTFNRVRGSAAMSRLAEQRIRLYSAAHLVITNRLHVALPCLALDTPVIVVGDNLEDPRFSGLKCRKGLHEHAGGMV